MIQIVLNWFILSESKFYNGKKQFIFCLAPNVSKNYNEHIEINATW